MKLVSIVVVNWNGKDITKRCLGSIKENTKYPQYEIIVVDNGSTDGSQELIKTDFPGVKLIENKENLGFAIGINQGIKAAGGEYIFLLNNDVEVKEGWLGEIVHAGETEASIGIVGCMLVSPEGVVQHTGGYLTSAGIAKHHTSGGEREVEYVTGAAMLIKKEVIEDIGYLDEKFSPFYFEEMDFCFRARKRGYKVIYTPSATMIHNESFSMKKRPDNLVYFVKNKNRIRLMLIHFSKTKLFKGTFWEVLRIFKSVFKLRTHLLIKAYAVNLKDVREILEKRRTK